MPVAGHQFDLFDWHTRPPTQTRPVKTLPPAACYWDYCPNCSARLHNVGCKYRCPRCHYFMSCSDYD